MARSNSVEPNRAEPNQAEPSLADRAAKSLLESIGQALWGFKPNLMGDIVNQEGPVRSVAWFARNMPKYERIRKGWGPTRTHIAATIISTLNSCRYCTASHAYALQLHFLAENDRLFPLTNQKIDSLNGSGDEIIVAEFEQVLELENLVESQTDLVRIVELRNNPGLAATKDDKSLIHLIAMFETLNRCGIEASTAPDEAHDPINRDANLKSRYAKLRTG